MLRALPCRAPGRRARCLPGTASDDDRAAGIEPSHELEALQHNILTQDRSLDLHAPERAAPNQGGAGAGATTGRFKQRIRFCTAIDGVKIAYASHGTGPPIVRAANWLTHRPASALTRAAAFPSRPRFRNACEEHSAGSQTFT